MNNGKILLIVSSITVEELQTFVEHVASTMSLNMKCKLINSKKSVKFCRFLRLNDDVGFNLELGRGEAGYRYFGNGFHNQECGISIEKPDSNDKSVWKCLIGVDDEGTLKTVGAIIDGSDPNKPNTQGLSHFKSRFSFASPFLTHKYHYSE